MRLALLRERLEPGERIACGDVEWSKRQALAQRATNFVRATESSFPVQTGMSDQGCTFCSVKNSSLTQVNFASDFRAPLIPSSIPPMPKALAGPVAL